MPASEAPPASTATRSSLKIPGALNSEPPSDVLLGMATYTESDDARVALLQLLKLPAARTGEMAALWCSIEGSLKTRSKRPQRWNPQRSVMLRRDCERLSDLIGANTAAVLAAVDDLLE